MIRGNVYDCIDVIYKNEIPTMRGRVGPTRSTCTRTSSSSIRSASDGPTIGFSYDMSLRAFTMLKDPASGQGDAGAGEHGA